VNFSVCAAGAARRKSASPLVRYKGEGPVEGATSVFLARGTARKVRLLQKKQ